MLAKITALFPVWAILFSGFAFWFPDLFVPLKSSIVPLLGVVMFGMGITLTLDDFASVFRRPAGIVLGTVLQYGCMPLIAWGLCHFIDLPRDVAAGVILVGCCPGGTASNVVCYLARGDVALSITLTSVSTMLSFILTPLLTWLYIGQTVSVPVVSMILSILKIVIVPVVLGVLLNHFWGRQLRRFKDLFPLVSVFSIVFIIAVIVGLNHGNLHEVALPVVACVMLHNLLGLGAGFWISKLLRFDQKTCRTLAIEVGMQNSGLGVALAVQYFSSLASLPGAIFSIWHNVSGSILAGYWSRTRSGRE